jgi:AcrR family transcriptional regulator
MQRKTAHPVNTRGEIVDAARRLFTTAGYDATSVQAIIAAVGVSKGTFYHYFQSKEEALDAVVEELTHESLAEVSPIVEDSAVSAVEKLNRFIATLRRLRLRNLGLVVETSRVLMRDENAIIRQKITRRNAALTVPLLSQIISQGVEEGVFTTPDPVEAAELILAISAVVGDRTFRNLFEKKPHSAAVIRRLTTQMEFLLDAFERILGAPSGSLERVPGPVVEQITQALQGQRSPPADTA